MKCAGCGKEIKGKSYCTYHYEEVRDESGNALMIEDHGPKLYFGDCCVVRGQGNGCGFRELVLKDHMWPYSCNRWAEPLKFLSEKGKELAKRGIDLLVEKKEYIITSWGDKFPKTKEEAIRKVWRAIQPLTENEREWYVLQTAAIEAAKRLMHQGKEAA